MLNSKSQAEQMRNISGNISKGLPLAVTSKKERVMIDTVRVIFFRRSAHKTAFFDALRH